MLAQLRTSCLIILATLPFTAPAAWADSTQARCEIVSKLGKSSHPCTFSQRQGHINISVNDGTSYDFRPAKKARQYTDPSGNRVVEKLSLADKGLVFVTKRERVKVYWEADATSDASESQGAIQVILAEPTITAPYDQQMDFNSLSFHIACSNDKDKNTLRITPKGLATDNTVIEREIEGKITGAEIVDLNADGAPELFIYIRGPKAGGSVFGLASNKNKSVSEIFMPALSDTPKYAKGYRGHDQFAVVERNLERRFPVYSEGAPDEKPQKIRQLSYKLKPGEAGWTLIIAKSSEF